MEKNTVKEFKEKLADLLQRYGARIEVGYDDGSDTHGMTGEHMIVVFQRKEHRLSDSWSIDPYDLMDEENE